ncbi:hypothetical protein Taro_028385 [Colocasia esculenta]|uniref:Uncharacterized protein n=1 Tax=Colocasia esculenta TaxID=4460 RepID=A0A843VIF0_COLES|nr:hypothetical protein [Colocasia esculenta]
MDRGLGEALLGLSQESPRKASLRVLEQAPVQSEVGDAFLDDPASSLMQQVDGSIFRTSDLGLQKSEKLSSTSLDAGISVGVHGVDAYSTQASIDIDANLAFGQNSKTCRNHAHLIPTYMPYVPKDKRGVRLLPLGRLRSRKIRNFNLHPLKKKATIRLSRPRRRRSSCRVQDYQESLPHDLLEESARPWVAAAHTTESHHHDDGGPSQNIHPPQSDDQAAQLLHLIPQLDQSQIQTLMTALKGKVASSPSPRAGASRPAAATSGPHVVMGQADNTPIRPRTIRFTPFEYDHYHPRESRPRCPLYHPYYSPYHPESRARPTSHASSVYAQPSTAPDMMSKWASIMKELKELRKQVDPRQHHDVHMPNFNGLWVPSPSELPKYHKYNGSGNPYIHIKDFIYESTPYQHDRRLIAYLFRRSLDIML